MGDARLELDTVLAGGEEPGRTPRPSSVSALLPWALAAVMTLVAIGSVVRVATPL